jgi:23S rRNA (uracil1939-C5)-methyltransferase
MGKKSKRMLRELKVVDISTKGMGVAKDENGAVYFIKNTIPGDLVEAQIYKKRKGYFEAEPTQFLEKSPYRITPECEHFGLCGGCKWQHLDYQKQLHYKEKGVLQNLSKIGKVTPTKIFPILAAPEAYWYRNKLEFSFSNNRWLSTKEIEREEIYNRLGLGFHKPGRWDKIVSIERCHLQPDPSNQIRNALFKFAMEEKIPFYDWHKNEGVLRNLMIRNTLAGEFMVLLQFFEDNIEVREKALSFLRDTFPQITSLLYCINQKANDSIYDQDLILFSGKDHLIEQMDALRFKIMFYINWYLSGRL